jgi:hypothetical protein
MSVLSSQPEVARTAIKNMPVLGMVTVTKTAHEGADGRLRVTATRINTEGELHEASFIVDSAVATTFRVGIEYTVVGAEGKFFLQAPPLSSIPTEEMFS